MEAPVKRNVFLDWLFGGPPTADDLARRMNDRTPRWARNTKLSLYAFVPVFWVASAFGVTKQIPLFGLWLSQERTLVCLIATAAICALDWYFKRSPPAGR